MECLNFILGERRKVWSEVTCNDGAPFVIRNATYELKKYDKIVDSGECFIDNHVVNVMLEPPEKGLFCLIFSFEIGGEIIKEKVEVKVE